MPRPPEHVATTWGPYYYALVGPHRDVPLHVAWKVLSRQLRYAEWLWQGRQLHRYHREERYGPDSARWPSQHPGAVVDGYAVCLGCHWIELGYYGRDGVFRYPADLARRHETSNGAFRSGPDDRWRSTVRPIPSPPPVETPPIPRRVPILPLRIADRYEGGLWRSWNRGPG